MNSPLWRPRAENIAESNLVAFMAEASNRWRVQINDFPALYQWSITEPANFWQSVWDFCGVVAESRGTKVIINGANMEQAIFFPEARLNYAQNLLRRRDQATAIEYFSEDKIHRQLSFAELAETTSLLVQVLRDWEVNPHDRVAAYLPNVPETVIAMLATSAIGALWASCSVDFGVAGVIDRFRQIEPKVLLVTDGYYYGGKYFDCLERIAPIKAAIPSIEHIILVSHHKTATVYEGAASWENLLAQYSPQAIEFTPLPFNHPLWILFSSGTTGVPKCIVHGVGGTLLQHLKEHQLHCNIKPGEVVFYHTTCGWMMWNWLVSVLASQATIVLYDGSPLYPAAARLFDLAATTKMTVFGTSAKYIDAIAKIGLTPINTHTLPGLKMILSTGSPLSSASFEYVYRSIKQDVCLASMSGGTDIVSCFVLGNPIGPVWAGEIMTAGLGMRVEIFDDAGNTLLEQKGELVCSAPFPCQPLGFWKDNNGDKYHHTYFARYPNVWHHGDFAAQTKRGGFIIYGRSDAVLKPSGVRIGTAEIYRQVEQLEEVLESIAVGQEWDNDVRIVLFVKLQPHLVLDDALRKKIKMALRTNASPHHVPALIFQVSDIPRTKNNKLAEIAVRETIHGRSVQNKDALNNPETLQEYAQLAKQLL